MLNLRKRERYDMSMNLSYSYRRNGSTWVGAGRTMDLSDEAVHFENEGRLPKGAEIELHIAWPFRLQSICPLELVVRGSVLRSSNGDAVVKLKSYEFRTCGERSFDQAASLGTACNVLG
jgi:hypothetical protein